MLYATRDDMVAAFGVSEIEALESMVSNDPVVSVEVSARALEDACAEADSYIAVSYSLPLVAIPSSLKRTILDMARFLMWKDRPSDEVRARYDKAIKWLVSIAKGQAVLIFPEGTTPLDHAPNTSAPHVPDAILGGVFNDGILNLQPQAAWFGNVPSTSPSENRTSLETTLPTTWELTEW